MNVFIVLKQTLFQNQHRIYFQNKTKIYHADTV